MVEPVHLGKDISTEKNFLTSIHANAALLPAGGSLREAVDEFQRDFIRRAVAERKGNWSAAARDLNMHRSNLHKLAARLGLRPSKIDRRRR